MFGYMLSMDFLETVWIQCLIHSIQWPEFIPLQKHKIWGPLEVFSVTSAPSEEVFRQPRHSRALADSETDGGGQETWNLYGCLWWSSFYYRTTMPPADPLLKPQRSSFFITASDSVDTEAEVLIMTLISPAQDTTVFCPEFARAGWN